MSNSITGKEYSLSKIFSPDFEYHIPFYQRPYAWEEEQAETLVFDLIDFYKNEQQDNYFLGSIVLIKEDDKPKADVIDGQQRLTTLTILIALIANMLTGKRRESCVKYLMQPGDEIEGLEDCPRLHLREQDQAFFEKHIQNINFDDLLKIDVETLQSESQRHIVLNSKVMQEKLIQELGSDENEITKFAKFVVSRCFLVAVSSSNKKTAFRVFSVMNNRGLELLPIDVIKADVVGKISNDKQATYTEKWESLELDAGRSGFNEVFTHTRMIFAKSKAKKTLIDEFAEIVLPEYSPVDLIDNIITPYTEAYITLKGKSYAATSNADEVNIILMWLNKNDNNDWLPPAMKFFAEHKNESDYILWFVKNLERMATFLNLSGKNVNDRIERYAQILSEMEEHAGHNINDKLTSVELNDKEKEEFLSLINSDIYRMTGKRRNFFLLRLDSIVSDGAASYDPKKLTIEHVLPQTVNDASEWAQWWPDINQRQNWLHKMANLVPLTRQQNSKAQNFDFDKKKKAYFQNKDGTTSYRLTTWVIGQTEWTPGLVEQRQKELADKLSQYWDLDCSAIKAKIAAFTLNPGESLYRLSLRGADAFSILQTDGKLLVKAGSKISYSVTQGFPDLYKTMRTGLITEKKIDNGVFVEDYLFDSLSAASCVIIGRSSDGVRDWELIRNS